MNLCFKFSQKCCFSQKALRRVKLSCFCPVVHLQGLLNHKPISPFPWGLYNPISFMKYFCLTITGYQLQLYQLKMLLVQPQVPSLFVAPGDFPFISSFAPNYAFTIQFAIVYPIFSSIYEKSGKSILKESIILSGQELHMVPSHPFLLSSIIIS